MSNYYRLACGLIAALVSQAGFAQSDIQQSLIERGLFWQARDDGKRAAEAWTKLLEISPDNPQALYGLATIDLKAGRLGQAQTYLQRLQHAHPNDPMVAQLAQDIRLSSPENKALLEEVRQAFVSADYDTALKKYEQAFQGKQPVGNVGRDYYSLLGYTPNGLNKAITNLQNLQKQSPQDTTLELSLARHLSRNEQTRLEGIQRLALLSENREIGHDAAESWRDALLWLGPPFTAETQSAFQKYLSKNPNDEELRQLLEQGRTQAAQARQSVQTARPVPPDPLRQRTNTAMKLVDAGDVAAARAEFESVLAKRPDDSEALGGLGVLAMREGHWQQAQEYLIRARRGNAAWQSSLNTTRYWIEVEKAQAAYQAGEIAQARRLATQASRLNPQQVAANIVLADIMLEEGQTDRAINAYQNILKRQPGNAQALFGLSRATRLAGNQAEASHLLKQVLAQTPENAWAHYELAMAYRHEGKTAEAQKIIDELIKSKPDDPQVLQISAMMAAENQQWSRARATLDRIPDNQRNAAINQLYASVNRQSQIADAVNLAHTGKKAEAIQWLEQISEGAGSHDLAITNAVAKAYVDIGEPSRGLALLKPLRTQSGERGVDASISYVGLLMAADQDMDASLMLRQLQAEKLTASQRERVEELADGYRIRQAEQLTAKGQLVAAYNVLEPVLKRRPDDLAVQGALARMYAANGESAKALAIYEKLIEADPNNAQLHLGMALLAQQTGNDTKARRETEKAVELAPDNHQVLVTAARLSRDSGRSGDAVKLLEQALSAESSAPAKNSAAGASAPSTTNPFVDQTAAVATTSSSDLARELEALYEQRSAQIRAGLEIRNRNGESGTSQLTSVQTPLELLFPAGNGQVSIQVTPVTLNAGAIKVPPYYGPANLTRYNPSLVNDQSQTGVGFALGYRYRGMEFDGGVTPVGFQQTNFVGGALFTGTLDDSKTLSYRLDVSRRAVTDSLLSFAGRRYDSLGLAWGGVTATGARLTLAKNFGNSGIYGTAAWHTLRGHNVATNQRLEFNAGAYVHVIDEANTKFTAGINANATFFKKNLGAFTYGSGGYFSPQQYYGLSLPLSWAQRSGAWTYRLDGAIGIQQINQSSAPVFPNNADMQAYATQMAGTNNLFGNGYFPGQNKTSFSYNLRAAAEYKMSPHMVVGVTMSANNAEDYREWMGGLYLRYFFHPQTSTLLNLPVEPYRSPYSDVYGR